MINCADASSARWSWSNAMQLKLRISSPLPRVLISLNLILLALSVSGPAGATVERIAPPLVELSKLKAASAGAQVLFAFDRREVQPDHHWQSAHYVAIRINDLEAARDYGRIRISYNHYYSDLDLDYANVLTPDGQIKPVDGDALQRMVGGSQDFYEDRTTLVFSLPDITPGAVLEFQFRKRSKNLSLASVFHDVGASYWYQTTFSGDSARMDPVLQGRYELVVPKAMQLEIQRQGPVAPKYSRKAVGEQVHHLWQWQNLPAIAIERAMPPLSALASRVEVSTSRDWGEVARWTWSLMADKLEPTEQIRALAKSLAPANADTDTKVRAVYEYVQTRVRYVFAHLGRGGYEPHAAADVIRQGYGDCKDQTVLALSLLKAMGVEAHPALVVTPRQGRPDMALVSVPFDHVVVWIPEGDQGRPLWLDTTGDRSLFPGFSSYLQGQPALIIRDGQSFELKKVDARLPENTATLNLRYHIDKRNHLLVDVTTELSGVYEQNMRNWWISDSERQSSVRKLLGDLFAQPQASLKAEAINADNLFQPMGLKARFDFGPAFKEGEAKSVAYAAGLHQVFRLFGDVASLQAPEQRKNVWQDDLPLTMAVRARFEAPGLGAPAVTESGINAKTAFFEVAQVGKREGDAYQLDVTYKRGPLHLSVAEYAKYHAAIYDLNRLGGWAVVFADSPEHAQLSTLQQKTATGKAASQLELARHLIDNGRFAEALDAAKAAVAVDKDSGEAWYLLGSAQGFGGLVDESLASFSKAQALGYTPE